MTRAPECRRLGYKTLPHLLQELNACRNEAWTAGQPDGLAHCPGGLDFIPAPATEFHYEGTLLTLLPQVLAASYCITCNSTRVGTLMLA